MSLLKDGGNMMLLRSIKLSKRLEFNVMHKIENTFPTCNDSAWGSKGDTFKPHKSIPIFSNLVLQGVLQVWSKVWGIKPYPNYVIFNPSKKSPKNKNNLMDFHWETKYVKGVMTKRKV